MFVKLNTIKKVKDFVKDANTFECDIDLIKGRYTIDAKSELGIFSIDLFSTLEVVIHTDDKGEIKRFTELMKRYQED